MRSLKTELYATLIDLFDSNCFKEIGVLFNICKDSGHLNELLEEWKLILENKGKEKIEHILKEEKTTIVDILMEFKNHTDKVIEISFNNNSEFRMGQKKSFESFLNTDANKVAEYMAKYLDMHLRKSSKTKITHSDKEMENIIQDTLTIFKFIHAKDVFQAFYLKGLSKRLLHKKSLSNDAEKYVLIILKRECGDEFTTKIEGMLKDISTSEIVVEEYVRTQNIDHKHFEIKILTQGNWPLQSRTQIKVPEAINSSFEAFASYYKMKYQGKTLHWSPTLSFCEVESIFDLDKPRQRTITIEVSLIQAAVLLLFNDRESYTFEEIMTEIAVDEETLENVLVSLCSMQYKVIKKSRVESRNVHRDESFSVNDSFRPKLRKITVTATTKKQSHQEAE